MSFASGLRSRFRHLTGSQTQTFAVTAELGRPDIRPAPTRTIRVLPRNAQPWQAEAWDLYEKVGELAYALDLVARTVGNGTLRLFRRLEDGTDIEVTLEPRQLPSGELEQPPTWYGPVINATTIESEIGDISAVMEAMSLNLDVAGECMCVFRAAPPDEQSVSGRWVDVLSTDEFIVDGKTTYRVTASARNKEPIPETDDVWLARFVNRSKRRTDKADNALRKTIPTVRRILKLNQVFEAILDSRRYADLLLVPNGISFGGSDEASDDDGTAVDDQDLFIEELDEHIGGAIQDHSSPAELLPGVLIGDGDELGKIKMFSMARPQDEKLYALYHDTIISMARSLDLPIEVVTGKADLNHWTGWNIDQDFLAKHVLPKGTKIAAFLTISYLWPILQKLSAEYGGQINPAEFHYVYDGTALGVKPDRSGQAVKLYELEVISAAALLRASDFDLADAPTEEELKIRRAITLAMMSADMAVAMAPVLGFDPVEIANAVAAARGTGNTSIVSAPTTDTPTQDGPPAGAA